MKQINIGRRLRSLFQRRAVKQEIDDELRFHLEQRTSENIAAGMSPEEAVREARKRFGNLQTVREKCRERAGMSFGEAIFQDVRFGARMLKKNPGFTAVALVTLALGVGANTTMFSLVNLLLFRPLAYPHPEQLARIYRISSRSPRDGHSIGVFQDVREQNTVFEHVAAYYPEWPVNLSGPGEPAELLSAMLVTADFFPTLGVQPEFGRGFTAEEDQPGRENVIVITHRLWQRRFNGDRNIVGRTIRLDGQTAVIVGVMPQQFHNALLWEKLDLIRPFAFSPEQRESRGDNWRFALGRLKAGVSMAQADAEMKALARRFASEHPKTEAGYGLRAISLRDSYSEENGPIMWFSLGIASFVLLLACANLASLLLARVAGRRRELAVRAALGASRTRLLRQLLTESLLLALLGGACGLLLAIWAKNWLGARLLVAGEMGFPIPLDTRVLGFTLVCCVLAALLFGTAPAWFASGKDVERELKEGSRGASGSIRLVRWRQALIIGEVAIAFVLLAGAGLFIRGLQNLSKREPGWRVDGLMTAQLDLTSDKYKTPRQLSLFFQQLGERLAVIPGVQNVSFSSRPPVLGPRMNRNIIVEGGPPAPDGQKFFAGIEPVGVSYFDTVGIRLKQGRLFTAADTAEHPDVVIINEALARRCWPNESPVGKRIGDGDSTRPAWEEIVGVVTDVRFPGEIVGSEAEPLTYRPLAQAPPAFAHVELRVAAPLESIATALRRAVAEIDPDQSIYKIVTAREFIRRELNNFTLLGRMLAAFAGLGLLLAAIGIYGVISCTVAQRTGEIGLRVALGAQRRDVLWLVLRQGLGHSLIGALLGLAGAVGLARVLSAAIPFPLPSNALTSSVVAVLLLGVALVAGFVPARRALRLHPMETLRYE